MRFVDDEDPVARPGGLVPNDLLEVAHLIDAAVTRGIELHDVEQPVLPDGHAGVADVAGLGCGAIAPEAA